jgi:adenylate kinase family enzyme
VRRVSVIGVSGAGKTTVGRAIADALDLPFLELDGVYHQPGWTELPPDRFRASVALFVAGDGWVVDGNYTASGALDLVWENADTVVWLDLPRRVAVRQVAGRTIVRSFTRAELWNGNREGWFAFLDPRPGRNMILWSWTTYRHNRDKYEARTSDPRWAHLDVVRLTDSRAVQAFLDSLSGGPR